MPHSQQRRKSCTTATRGRKSIRRHDEMADVWKHGTGLGDVRLDERADMMLEQMVATHSVVLKARLKSC